MAPALSMRIRGHPTARYAGSADSSRRDVDAVRRFLNWMLGGSALGCGTRGRRRSRPCHVSTADPSGAGYRHSSSVGRQGRDRVSPRRRPDHTLHTAWDIARALAATDAIGWIDALARRRRLSVAEMRREATRHLGEMGSRRATSTLARADPRAESPPESRLRLAFHEAGFAVPVPQFTVIVGGCFIARVDLAWPQWRVAVEYDGQWHADRQQLHRDRSRLRELNAAGWYVYPVTREDTYDMPRLVAQIAALLDRRRRAFEPRSVASSRQGC